MIEVTDGEGRPVQWAGNKIQVRCSQAAAGYSRPTRPGMYWAKCAANLRWEIVQVKGEAPFLEIRPYNPNFGMAAISLKSIHSWGPEVPYPPDDDALSW